MAKRPSTPAEKPAATPRELPLVALRETVIFPGDDRPAPGRAREERRRAQRRRRERRPHRARHPAAARAGGDLRSLRALPDRHAGQDRPGRAAPGRHRPGHRPGPGPDPRQRLRHHLAVPLRGGRGAVRRRPDRRRDPGAGPQRPGPDRAVRRQRRARAARGGRRRPQHHRARPPRRHGGLQPRHVDRAAPGAPRDHRRRAAPEARLRVPRPPDRDPRAEGEDPERGQVRDGQDPAGVHPPRAAQGDPARAGRGRPAAGRDQRAAREGRAGRHAGGGPRTGDQGDRPDEPDPVRLARGRRDPDLRGLARVAAVERVHGRPPRHPRGRPDPRRGPLRPREDQGAHPRVPLGAHPRGHDPQPDPAVRRALPASARRAWARASPRRWAASSCA